MLTSTKGTVMADQANRQLYYCSATRSNAAAAQHVTPGPWQRWQARSCTSAPSLQGGPNPHLTPNKLKCLRIHSSQPSLAILRTAPSTVTSFADKDPWYQHGSTFPCARSAGQHSSASEACGLQRNIVLAPNATAWFA